MAAITWLDVTGIAPELVSLSIDAQTLILNYVNEALDITVFDGEDGALVKALRVYLAAHIGTMTSRANSNKSGAVTDKSLGPQSTKWASNESKFAGQYGDTQYGVLYSTFVNTSSARGPILL